MTYCTPGLLGCLDCGSGFISKLVLLIFAKSRPRPLIAVEKIHRCQGFRTSLNFSVGRIFGTHDFLRSR